MEQNMNLRLQQQTHLLLPLFEASLTRLEQFREFLECVAAMGLEGAVGADDQLIALVTEPKNVCRLALRTDGATESERRRRFCRLVVADQICQIIIRRKT